MLGSTSVAEAMHLVNPARVVLQALVVELAASGSTVLCQLLPHTRGGSRLRALRPRPLSRFGRDAIPQVIVLDHNFRVLVWSRGLALVAAGYDPNAALIKRVVGLPGEQLDVRDGQLLGDNSVVHDPWVEGARVVTRNIKPVRA